MNGYYNLDLPGSSVAFHNPTIQAAILSVAHSFRVQNYQVRRGQPGRHHRQRRDRPEVPWDRRDDQHVGIREELQLRHAAEVPVAASLPDADHAAAWQIVTWVEQKAACAYNATTTC